MNRLTFFQSVILTVALLVFSSAHSQVPCENGMAGIYPCDQVDFLSSFTREELNAETNFNDVWGWTDEDSQREFALVGMGNGTSFVEVTDPLNPLYIGTLYSEDGYSLWRDIKVFNNYAFIVSEGEEHGMQIFDLTHLLAPTDSLPITFLTDAYYDLIGDAHNVVINEETGFAYAVGTNSYEGGLHFIDINDPLYPTIAGGFDGDGYTHDAQVVLYDGPDPDYLGREIAFCYNEDAVTIVDVTDKTDPVMISSTGYELSSYTHQGWATHDLNFLIFNDEIDETDGFTETTKTFFLDIRDLDMPVVHYEYFSTSTAIDHNLYTNGSLCYQSNYRAGLRILDVGNVHQSDISEVAFFDTQPADDVAVYSGTWSNYAYFKSGTILLTDMYSNFFILRANLVNASRYAEVCGLDERADYFIDVTYNAAVASVYPSAAFPENMELVVGEIPEIGAIPVSVELTGLIEEGEYTLPITVASADSILYETELKMIVSNPGVSPTFNLSEPEDNAMIVESETTLEWSVSPVFPENILTIAIDSDFEYIVYSEAFTTNTFEFTGDGTHYWKIEVQSPCERPYESEVRSFTTGYVGVEEINSPKLMYPNPVQHTLHLKGFTEVIQVIAIDGRVIKEFSPSLNETVFVGDLAPGTYLLQETYGKNYKFIKE